MKRTLRDRRMPWVLAALAVVMAATWTGAFHRETLIAWTVTSEAAVTAWVDANPVVAAVLYVITVALGKVSPFPGGIILMLAGGYLFGPVSGALLAAAGASMSAALVAIVGRQLLFGPIHRRWGARLAPIEEPMTEDGFSYLLAARLLPVLPAWLVNLVPVAFPIPVSRVMLATFLGLLPISFVLANVGNQLSTLAMVEGVPTDILLRPGLLLPLAGLALLALVPVIYKHRRRRRGR